MIQMQLHFKRQKYSNNTINKFTEMVKMVYQFNAVNNFIDGNPIRDLKKLKKEIKKNIKDGQLSKQLSYQEKLNLRFLIGLINLVMIMSLIYEIRLLSTF